MQICKKKLILVLLLEEVCDIINVSQREEEYYAL